MGKCTVREVHEKLTVKKPSGYTTTLKLMQIMLEKGLVGRNKDAKSHVYFATLLENDAQEYLLSKLVNAAFRGSRSKLVLQALGGAKTSKKELDEIREYLDSIEDQNE